MVPEARLRDWIMDEACAQKLLQARMGALTATRQIGLGQDMPLGLEE
nr:hypothetical protein [Lacticaseibacillus thailandensis]